MRRYLRDRQRVRLLAAFFAKRMALTHVNWHPRPEIGQAEVHPTVASIGGAEEGKERLVLVDRQELPVAKRPAFRREGKTHDSYFGKERFSHGGRGGSRS